MQDVAYFQGQYVGQTWLYKKAIATRRLGLALDPPEHRAGEHNDSGASRSGLATQPTREVETGFARGAHVGNDDVRCEAAGVLEALFRRRRYDWLKAHGQQPDRIHRGRVFVVIDEQHHRELAKHTSSTLYQQP
jgi:hypothetical protein